MSESARNRGGIENAYDNYKHELSGIRTSALAGEEGATADAAREAFQHGENHAGKVASKNSIKQQAFSDACTSLQALRSGLSEIADKGSTAIEDILADKKKMPPVKLGEIVDIVVEAQAYAAHRAQQHIAKIGEGISAVLKADGDPRTLEGFAKAHGLSLAVPKALDKEVLTQQFRNLIESPPVPPRGDGQLAFTSSGVNNRNLDAPDVLNKTQNNLMRSGSSPGRAAGDGTPGRIPAQNALTNKGVQIQQGIAGAAMTAPIAGTPSSTSTNAGPVSSGTAFGSGHGTSSALPPSIPSALPTAGPSAPAAAQPLSPEILAHSFNNGVDSGAPASATGEALSQSFSHAAQSPVAQQPVVTPSAATTPSSGSHYAFDYPQTHSSDASSTYTQSADTASQMYATPAATSPAPPAAAMPTAPAGPLPTYGSDLRPPTPTPTVSTPLGPAAASPMSAPVNPSSGQSTLGQPAVVKQQPVTPAAHSSAAGLTENAVAATATGAIAGAASEQSAAQSRLQSLVEVVARQEPRLRWAVGDRGDGTTILATDLACGWIPPHIEIPSGVTLLTPERRRGDFESLIGDTTNTATWTPGHYLPPEKDLDPVPTSFRARQVPDIDELNWELTQATNWRDGLPRLAHTLAKAGTAGTGVLDSETDLLHEHLTTIGQKVLKAYPYGVDAADVGNWQLLAAIDALLSGQRTNLNYHFAWFQALSMTTHGGVR